KCLGPEMNLGRLPSLSSVRPASSCAVSCGDYLEVRFPSPHSDGRATVPLEAGGLEFKVGFDVMSDVDAYYVSLDRLWFWYAARQAALSHGVKDDVPGSVVVRRFEVPQSLKLY